MDTLHKGLETQPLRVLIVEDRPEDAELMLHALRRESIEPDWKRVDNEEAFLKGLEGKPEIVLSDFLMPEFSGMRALELLMERAPDIPLIIVSGSIGEDIAVEVMRRGATDYLLKDRLARLGAAVRSALELKRARDTQRRVQSEIQRLAAIVESSQDAIISRGLDRTILTWNPAAERLFGWGAAEAVGRSISIIIPPERQQESIRNRAVVHRGTSVPTYDTVRLAKDGRPIDVSLTQSPVKNDNGDVIAVSLIFRDITERKLSERRRAMEHTITRVLAESPSLDVAMPRLIRSVCEAMEWAYGARWMWDERERNLVRLEYWSEFEPDFDPSDRHYWLQLGKGGAGGLLRRAWLGKTPTWLADINREATFLRKPSCAKFGLHSAYSFPILADTTAIGVMEFFGRDVREPDEMLLQITLAIGRQIGQFIQRKQAEGRLALFRTLIDQSNDAIEVIDPEMLRFLDVNEKACRDVGYSRADLLSLTVPDIDPSVDASSRTRIFEELRKSGFVMMETLHRRKDGSTFPVEVNINLVQLDQSYIVAIARDITERKEAEEKIRRLNRVYAVLSSINALIVRVRDRQELLDEACRIAVEQGRLASAWVGMLDPATLDIVPVAYAGEGADELRMIKSTARDDPPRGQGAVSRAVRERRAVFNNDLMVQSFGGPRLEIVLKLGFRSMIALPLFNGDAVAGTLTLHTKEPGFFDDEEIRLLTELASDISFALQYISKEEKLDYLAYYDALTGLPNRALLDDRMRQRLQAASHGQALVALVLIDLDRFRIINDIMGRHAGDALIKLIAGRLQSAIFDRDSLARVHGDVFAALLADVGDEADIARIVDEKLIGCLNQPFMLGGQELQVSARAGVALYPSDATEPDGLFSSAEAALRQAKASNDRYLFYARKMNAQVAERLKFENKLRRALEKEQFVLHYQPKVDLASGRIGGVEALICWNDPETGLVPPMQFIPLLEETGMILEAGGWAIRKALEDYQEWHARALRPPRIAVNVSPVQLRQTNFVDVVRNAIGALPAGSHGLDLELTESVVMEDIEGNIDKLRMLRDMGINIAIDDFGTGYSSLGYLARLPVNALKIDRSFIITMATNPDSMTIVSTIISLAHNMSLMVIAEGVETEEQSKFLRLLRCDEIQGYLISTPLPAADLAAMLQERRDS